MARPPHQAPPGHAPPLDDFPPLGGSNAHGPHSDAFASDPRPSMPAGFARQARGPEPRGASAANGQPLPMASAANAHGPTARHHGPIHGGGGGGNGAGAFTGPRSPPNAKNTAHVPCKFFRQGQCQAGNACPFSHSLDASKFEQPCKYFAKGNCKFGQKCALLHVLPNGRVVNRGNGTGNMGSLNLGNRVEPTQFPHHESALGNSLLAQQRSRGVSLPFGQQMPGLADLGPNPPQHVHSSFFDPMSSNLGPRDDRYPGSPTLNVPKLDDVKLPASFDSNGYSYMARFGPVAASMPSKVGIESPPASFSAFPETRNDAIRNLHDSVYGLHRANVMASSPPAPFGEAINPRMLHSQRFSRAAMISTSMPRPILPHDDSDDNSDGTGEEFVPSVLSHLLNPDERQRRSSGKVEEPISIRNALMGDRTPGESSSKIGSPNAASPSRFSALFSKQKREEDLNGVNGTTTFGPVGSPLRNSGLQHLATSPGVRATPRSTPTESAFHISSPPRYSSSSILSQQLRQTRLGSPDPNESTSRTGPSRSSANPRSPFQRALSGSFNTQRIDEEQEFVFSLDDEDEEGGGHASSKHAGSWNAGSRSPLGSIGDGRPSLDAYVGAKDVPPDGLGIEGGNLRT